MRAKSVARLPESGDNCSPQLGRFPLDSSESVAKAVDELIGDTAVPIEHTVSTFHRDSSGYTIRLTPVDLPGTIVIGAAGIVRVCLDGRARILSVDQSPK